MKNLFYACASICMVFGLTLADDSRASMASCTVDVYRWQPQEVGGREIPLTDKVTTNYKDIEFKPLTAKATSAKMVVPLPNDEKLVASLLLFEKDSAMFAADNGEPADRLMIQGFFIRGSELRAEVIHTATASSDEISNRKDLERRKGKVIAQLTLSDPIQATMEKRYPGLDPLQLIRAGHLRPGSIRDIEMECEVSR